MYEFIRQQKLNIAIAISVIILVLFYAVGASAASYDYRNGILDNPDYKDYYTHNFPPAIYDNSLSSSKIFKKGDQYEIEFLHPLDLDVLFLRASAFYSNYSAHLYVQVEGGEVKKINYDVQFDGKGKYIDIGVSDVVKVIFRNSSSYDYSFGELEFFGEFKIFDITKLNAKSTHDSVSLNYSIPKDILSTDKIVIYQDGKKVKELGYKVSNVTIDNLKDDTDYNFKVVIERKDGTITKGSTVSIKTTEIPIVPQDVLSVNAKATHERVDLSWQLPNNHGFKHVNIYRDEDKGLLKNLFGAIDPTPVVYAADDDDTKIFETNGTYFNDLTVKPDTKYKYKLTTTTTDGQESKGVTKSVKTAKKPAPEPPKSEIEVNDNDDYVVKWSQDKGSIKIFVGDKLYATVEASKGSHTIPRDDMVYNWLDQPQIKVVWVDEDGDESESAVPGLPGTSEGGMPDIGLVNPISALDVTTNVFDFLRILSPYLLIAMLIRLAVQIINVIRYRVLINRKHERRAREEEMYGDYRNRYGDSD